MRKIKIIIIILLGIGFLPNAPNDALAQATILRGFITSGINGQPLQGASVVLRQHGQFITGTASGRHGIYVLSGVKPGDYLLQVTFVGFEAYVDTLILYRDDIRTLNIELAPSEKEMDEVVVESENTGATSITAGKTSIRPIDVKRIPSVTATPDLVNYLTTLPGVVAAGDQGGQLYIRGGKATQNLVLIDGIVVHRPFHLIGFSSIFPADVLGAVDLYAGGFGSRYGGKLSSVLDVTIRNGAKHHYAGAASIDPLLAALRVEGPVLKDRISLLVSVRRSIIADTAPILLDRRLPYTFSDQLAKAHAIINETNQVSVTYMHSQDRGSIGVQEDVPIEEEIIWENTAFGVRYVYLPRRLPVLAEITLSRSSFENKFSNLGHPTRSASAHSFHGATHLTYFLRNAEVRGGFYIKSSHLAYQLNGFFQDLQDRDHFQTEAAAYLESALQLGEDTRVTPGVRVSAFPSSGNTYIEPRLRAVWELTDAQISAAWGLYHQEVVGLQDERDAGSVFTAWVPQIRAKTTPTAMHSIIDGQFHPAEWLTLSAGIYYKKLSDLFIPEWNAFAQYTTRLQTATGRVYGADVRVEAEWPNFYGYIGYGYANTEYKTRTSMLPGAEIERFPPPHDRRHNLNVLGQVTWSGFVMSARWQFGSGLPYTRILGFDDWIMMEGLVDVVDFDGLYRAIYDDRYRQRLPTYHRLDVSLEREFMLSSALTATVKAGMFNTYNRRNLFYYDLFEFRRVDQLPLIPSVSLKVELR